MKASFRYVLAYASLAAFPFLSGCTTSSPEIQTRVISVPSSKPYRYITFSKKDDPKTVAQIVTHNATHAAVKRKEKEAEAKAAP